MKRTIVFLLCMIGIIITFGQNRTQNLLQEIKCTPPQFTGIDKAVPILVERKFPAIEQYLIDHITYPEEDLRYYNQGTEVVSFFITPIGNLTDIKIINSVSNGIDRAIIEALEATNGMWKPGYNDDKPAAMEKEISIIFKIGDFAGNNFTKMAKHLYADGSRALLKNSNPKKALRSFDNAMVYIPNDKALLVLRGLTRFELGNKEGALKDWTRVKTLGGIESQDYLDNFNSLKGYAELRNFIAN